MSYGNPRRGTWPFLLLMAAIGGVGVLAFASLLNSAGSNLLWSKSVRGILAESAPQPAVSEFEAAVQASPANESLIYGLAMLQMQSGETDAAIQTLDRGAGYYPHNQRLARVKLLAEIAAKNASGIIAQMLAAGLPPQAIINVANAKMAASEWGQAISLFEAMQQHEGSLAPKDRFLLGKAYLASNEVNSATASLLSVISDTTASAALQSEANANLGTILFWQEPEQAAVYIANAASLDPTNVSALMLAGDFAFLQKGDIASMNGYFDAATKLNANSVAAWLAISLTQSERQPDPRWAWLGTALELADRPCDALDAYRKVAGPAIGGERITAAKMKCDSEPSSLPQK